MQTAVLSLRNLRVSLNLFDYNQRSDVYFNGNNRIEQLEIWHSRFIWMLTVCRALSSTYFVLKPSSHTSNPSTMTEHHTSRLEEQRTRADTFERETRKLSEYLGSAPRVATQVDSLSALAQYDIAITEAEDYCDVTQSNLPHFSTLLRGRVLSSRRQLHAHVIHTESDKLSDSFRTQLTNEMIALLRYFAGNKSGVASSSSSSSSSGRSRRNSSFPRLFDIFIVQQEKQLIIANDKMALDATLKHKIWNELWTGNYKVVQIKMWTSQLAQAADVLNQAGVTHRFIRPENVLLSNRDSSRIRLANFDFACRFWDADTRSQLPITPKGLPLPPESLGRHLLDHLPPECFNETYDGAMVDVWSIGTIMCMLFTGENPFDSPKEQQPPDHLQRWRYCEERRLLSVDLCSILDDIFQESNARITVWELADDARLKMADWKEFQKAKLPPYYRIDVSKGINVHGPPNTRGTISQTERIPDPNPFHPSASEMFESKVSYEDLKMEGEPGITKYQVLREESFGKEFSPKEIVNDYYLKAKVKQSNQVVWLKIVPLRRLPVRHRNMFLNESTKIMRYFSQKPELSTHIHKVLDVYLVNEAYFYIFYESLAQYQSIHSIVQTALDKQISLPPPSRSTDTDMLLTLVHIQAWMQELTATIVQMAWYGLSHRYIRPEYVFISKLEPTRIKLSHFDMSCFVHNPSKQLLVRRTRGLQDDQEHMWDHLPPEVYSPLYDCLPVDEWSVGVLFVYCLTTEKPFKAPLTLDQSRIQWAAFKKKYAYIFCVNAVTAIPDALFVESKKRLDAKKTADKFFFPKLNLARLLEVPRRPMTPMKMVKSSKTTNSTFSRHSSSSGRSSRK